MSIKEILGGGAILALLTIVQVSPIKINPWSALIRLFKWFLNQLGRATSGDVMAKLDELDSSQQEAKKQLGRLEARLDNHIKADDTRDADAHRMAILQFNNSLLRNRQHTKEEFIEVLAEIDAYERFCDDHPEYPNNRAVLAIENIRENYKERLQKHDFLQDGQRRDPNE